MKRNIEELLKIAKEVLATKQTLEGVMDKHLREKSSDLFWDDDYTEGSVQFVARIPFNELVDTDAFEWLASVFNFDTAQEYLSARTVNGKLDVAKVDKEIASEIFNPEVLADIVDHSKFFQKYDESRGEKDFTFGKPPDFNVSFDGKTVTITGSFSFE